jgi:hypothetical protein
MRVDLLVATVIARLMTEVAPPTPTLRPSGKPTSKDSHETPQRVAPAGFGKIAAMQTAMRRAAMGPCSHQGASRNRAYLHVPTAQSRDDQPDEDLSTWIHH